MSVVINLIMLKKRGQTPLKTLITENFQTFSLQKYPHKFCRLTACYLKDLVQVQYTDIGLLKNYIKLL